MNRKSVFLTIVLLLLTLSVTALAQEPLTQSFTSQDGMLTMSYPDGWEASEDNGLIAFVSDQASLQVTYREVGEDITPLDIMNAGLYGFGEAESLILAGYAATLSRSADQIQIVINFCDGILSNNYGFTPRGQVATYEPTFLAMLDSIRFGDAEPRLCRGSYEGLSPITPANAASVAQVGAFGDEADPVRSLAISPDGKLLAVGTTEREARVLNLVTGQEDAEIGSQATGTTGLAFDRSSSNLVTGSGIGVVQIWEVRNGAGLGQFQRHSGVVTSVALSPVDFWVVSGGADGSVRVWDMIQAGEQTPLDADDDTTPVTSVAFSPDGTLVAAGGGSVVRVWDAPAGTLQATLDAEIPDIATIAFNPDGSRLAYGGADAAVWVWDLANGNSALLQGHDERVNAVAFSPNGQVIATGDATSLRLWDAATGAELAVLPNPAGQAVTKVAFNPDGSLVVSGGEAGGVVIWGTIANGGQAGGTTEETSETSAATATPEETSTTGTGDATCTVSVPGSANLRSGPGTNFDRAGALAAGQSITIDGQAAGADGFAWYRLTDGTWVRSDVIGSPASCTGVPAATP